MDGALRNLVPNIILELRLLFQIDRPYEVELVASTVEYDDERERTPFSETKHRVPLAVSGWCHRGYRTPELVSVIAGRS